jgi:hypothetical protein
MNHKGHAALGKYVGECRGVVIAQLAIENRRGDVMLFK